MLTAEKLKNLMSVLLIATAVLHLVVAMFGAPEPLRVPLAVFGAIYGAFGVFVRKGGRAIILGAMAASATGLVLGGMNYLDQGGPVSLLVMFLIDIVVIGVGGLWLAKRMPAN